MIDMFLLGEYHRYSASLQFPWFLWGKSQELLVPTPIWPFELLCPRRYCKLETRKYAIWSSYRNWKYHIKIKTWWIVYSLLKVSCWNETCCFPTVIWKELYKQITCVCCRLYFNRLIARKIHRKAQLEARHSNSSCAAASAAWAVMCCLGTPGRQSMMTGHPDDFGNLHSTANWKPWTMYMYIQIYTYVYIYIYKLDYWILNDDLHWKKCDFPWFGNIRDQVMV